ncbi:hypothetical protein ACQZV8_02900 [Magnetococcales bacterium HHB-1]
MMKKRASRKFRGIVSHHIEKENDWPVAVVMDLSKGQKVRLNLHDHTLDLLSGAPLKEKKAAWCLEIGRYLARSDLLEQKEKAAENRMDGRQRIAFSVRPDPNRTWWG